MAGEFVYAALGALWGGIKAAPSLAAGLARRRGTSLIASFGRGGRAAASANVGAVRSLSAETSFRVAAGTQVVSRTWQFGFAFFLFILTCCLGTCFPFFAKRLAYAFGYVAAVIRKGFDGLRASADANKRAPTAARFFVNVLEFLFDFVAAIAIFLLELCRWIGKNAVVLVVLFAIVGFWVVFLANAPDTLFGVANSIWLPTRSLVNLGAGGLQLAADVAVAINPMTNAVSESSYVTAVAMAQVFASSVGRPVSIGGRRRAADVLGPDRVSLVDAHEELELAHQISATFAPGLVATSQALRAVTEVIIRILGPILPLLLSVAEVLLPKIACVPTAPLCASREIVDTLFDKAIASIVGIFSGDFSNFVGSDYVSIQCSADELRGGDAILGGPPVPCSCGGDIFGAGGIFSALECSDADEVTHSCSERGGSYCESVNGGPASCGPTRDAGCPNVRRALSSAKDALSSARFFENRALSVECVSVCDRGVLVRVCDDASATNLGTCANATIATKTPARRRAADVGVARSTIASRVRDVLAQAARVSPACDWTATDYDGATAAFDLGCVAAAVVDRAASRSRTGRRLATPLAPPRTFDDPDLRYVASLGHAIGRRRKLLTALDELAEATPLERLKIATAPLRGVAPAPTPPGSETSFVHTTVNLYKAAWARREERERARDEKETSRRSLSTDVFLSTKCYLNSDTSTPGFECPSGFCSPDRCACPEIDWDVAAATWSWTRYLAYYTWSGDCSIRAVSVASTIRSLSACRQLYLDDPSTYPFDASNRNNLDGTGVVYCFPMRPPLRLDIQPVTLDLVEAVEEACGDTASTSACACPQYYGTAYDPNVPFFALGSVAVGGEFMNGLIAAQYVISRFTAGTFVDSIQQTIWTPFLGPTNWFTKLFGDYGASGFQGWGCFALNVGSLLGLALAIWFVGAIVESSGAPILFLTKWFVEPTRARTGMAPPVRPVAPSNVAQASRLDESTSDAEASRLDESTVKKRS